MKKIELVGCKIFSDNGTVFQKGKRYLLPDDYADTLLDKETDDGMPFFRLASNKTEPKSGADKAEIVTKPKRRGRKGKKKNSVVQVETNDETESTGSEEGSEEDSEDSSKEEGAVTV